MDISPIVGVPDIQMVAIDKNNFSIEIDTTNDKVDGSGSGTMLINKDFAAPVNFTEKVVALKQNEPAEIVVDNSNVKIGKNI